MTELLLNLSKISDPGSDRVGEIQDYYRNFSECRGKYKLVKYKIDSAFWSKPYLQFKGTVNVISSDPVCKDVNA